MKYKIGDIIEGKVVCIKPYGIFIELDKHKCGLVHISEISNKYIYNIGKEIRHNEIVRVKIIDYDDENKRYRLSIKAIHNTIRKEKYYRYSNKTKPILSIGFKSLEDNLQRMIKEKLNAKN